MPKPLASASTSRLWRMMERKELHCVYQPIADLRQGSVYAHEALIRGPQGSEFASADALLRLAQEENLMHAFEMHCVFTALHRWGQQWHPGRLFVNISADALVLAWEKMGSAGMLALLKSHHVKPRQLVFEITGHERVLDMERLRKVAQGVHALGSHIALDNFGDSRSSLRLWSEIKPDFVKIDKYFAQGISQNAERLQVVQAVREIANVFGTSLVAEGIETTDDLRVLRDLDIRHGQGYLLGKPECNPLVHVLPEATEVMRDKRVSVMPLSPRSGGAGIVRKLVVVAAPTIGLQTTNEEVAMLFRDQLDLHAVAVVVNEKPVALISRNRFMTDYAGLYFRDVFGRHPATKHANHHPRLIERDYNVEELVGILTSQDQQYLTEGFIVTDHGRYVGLGTGEQLVRAVTEARIESARHANPLTFLPGNIPITQHIERLLGMHAGFLAAYVDLNHFKPFNDQYGYWRGDEMIRLIAQIVTQHCDPQRDFVGHVGGDDFIILFQSEDWHSRCLGIIERFAQSARMLFDEAARNAGGIHAEDRHGVKRFFPCTTVSIGLVEVSPGAFEHPEDVANAAALAKHDAKLSPTGLSLRTAQAKASDGLTAAAPEADTAPCTESETSPQMAPL